MSNALLDGYIIEVKLLEALLDVAGLRSLCNGPHLVVLRAVETSSDLRLLHREALEGVLGWYVEHLFLDPVEGALGEDLLGRQIRAIAHLVAVLGPACPVLLYRVGVVRRGEKTLEARITSQVNGDQILQLVFCRDSLLLDFFALARS